MAQSVRMSDVARAAQVSTMTVSRVLNGNANVLEETRRRVCAAIEQLGYRRNELARSLRERRSRQIGILVPNLYDSFFAQCAHAVSAVAKAHGYSVSIATTDESSAAEFEEASRMAQRHVEGLAVIPAEVKAGASRLLAPELSEVPIVVLDRPLAGGGDRADTLLVENRRGTRTGAEHLIALGHKRIAFLGLEGRLYTMRERHAGYKDAMDAAGLPTTEIFVGPDRRAIHAGTGELLAREEAPTALFCANNLLTLQVLHALQHWGIFPPEGMALVGFDDFETADLLRPGITVVRQPVEELARRAAEVLFARLGEGGVDEDGEARRGERIVLPVRLVVRGSCGTKEMTPEPVA